MACLTPIHHGSATWPHLGGANELPLFWFSNWRVTWNVVTLSPPQFYPGPSSHSPLKKKTYKDPKTKREKKSSCHKGRDICVPSLVWVLSMNTINLFRKRKRTAEMEKKAKELELGLTVANELLSLPLPSPWITIEQLHYNRVEGNFQFFPPLSHRKQFMRKLKGIKLLLVSVNITNSPIWWPGLVLHLEKKKGTRIVMKKVGRFVPTFQMSKLMAVVPTRVLLGTEVANDDLMMARPKTEPHSCHTIR